MGWIIFDHHPEKTTIEVQTSEIKEAVEKAGQEGEELIQQVGTAFEGAGERLKQGTEQASTDGQQDAGQPNGETESIRNSESPDDSNGEVTEGSIVVASI